MEIKDLVPVDYSNQRVLLTAQVAEVFGTTTERISHNFSENKHRFKEGEHYFKLIGAALRSFKQNWDFSTFAAHPLSSNTESFRTPAAPFSRMANCLYLWTEQGAMLHCKMVNTDEAWKMLKDLIAFYFAHRDNAAPPVETPLADEEPVKKVRRVPVPELAIVYAVLLSNTLVKIGYTRDLTARMKDLQKEAKADVLAWAASAVMTRDEAILLERSLKSKFFAHLVSGEFFNVDFEKVKAALVDDKFNKLLAIADRLQNPDEKDRLLLQAAAVLA